MPTAKLVAAPKLPLPRPGKSETLSLPLLAATMSVWPSPLKSPVATALGSVTPAAAKLVAAAKLNAPHWVARPMVWQAEISEVLPAGSVAVAVTTSPRPAATGSVTSKEALPEPSVVT